MSLINPIPSARLLDAGFPTRPVTESPAVMAFYRERAVGDEDSYIRGLDLNNSQVRFIAQIFLPIVGQLALVEVQKEGPPAQRLWESVVHEDARIVKIISSNGDPVLELRWEAKSGLETPQVTIDAANKVNTIRIPWDESAMRSEVEPVDLWRHHILQVLCGHSLNPLLPNKDRIQVGESLCLPSPVTASIVQAANQALLAGLPRFLTLAPPNIGEREALGQLTVQLAVDRPLLDRKLVIVLTQREDDARDLARTIQHSPQRDQFSLLLGKDNKRDLLSLIESVEVSARPTVMVFNTSTFRALLKAGVDEIGMGHSDIFDALVDSLEDRPYLPEELDLLTREIGDVNTDESSVPDKPHFEFTRMQKLLRGICFYNADHIGAPKLHAILSSLASNPEVVSLGTSNAPIHYRHNVFSTDYDGIVFRVLDDSSRIFLGNTKQRGLSGSMILHQLALGIQAGLYTPLDHVYMLPAASLLKDERQNLFFSDENHIKQLDYRPESSVYRDVFVPLVSLFQKHERGEVYVNTRDEAIRVTRYLNELFLQTPGLSRTFGLSIDGRTFQEKATSARNEQDFKDGKINYLVKVDKDGGPPDSAVSLFVDLSYSYNAKKFERRIAHLLAPAKGKVCIDVACLIERNSSVLASYFDLMLAVKNDILRPRGYVYKPQPNSVEIDTPEVGTLFTDQAAYAKYLDHLESILIQEKRSFWGKTADDDLASVVSEVAELLQEISPNLAARDETIYALPQVRKIRSYLKDYGELLYRSLELKERKVLDRLELLSDVYSELSHRFRITCFDEREYRSEESDAYGRPDRQTLQRIALLINTYVNRLGEAPPRNSILGRKLRFALNDRAEFLPLLEPQTEARIIDANVKSNRERFKAECDEAARDMHQAELAQKPYSKKTQKFLDTEIVTESETERLFQSASTQGLKIRIPKPRDKLLRTGAVAEVILTCIWDKGALDLSLGVLEEVRAGTEEFQNKVYSIVTAAGRWPRTVYSTIPFKEASRTLSTYPTDNDLLHSSLSRATSLSEIIKTLESSPKYSTITDGDTSQPKASEEDLNYRARLIDMVAFIRCPAEERKATLRSLWVRYGHEHYQTAECYNNESVSWLKNPSNRQRFDLFVSTLPEIVKRDKLKVRTSIAAAMLNLKSADT